MKRLPVNQISKGQAWAPQEPVEPETEIVKGDFGGQAGAQAVAGMGAFLLEAKGAEQAAIGCLDDLADTTEPLPQGLRPRDLGIALGRADDLDAVGVAPGRQAALATKAFVGHIGVRGRLADADKP